MRDHLIGAYGHTLDTARKLIADVECPSCAKLPHAGAKHPAWVLGHLAIAAGMGAELLGKTSPVPKGWEAWCGIGTEPGAERAAYPKKAELIGTLERGHEALVAAVRGASDHELDAVLPIPEYRSFFPTTRDAVFYLMSAHENYHLGQLSAWRRAAGMGPAGG